MYALPCCTLMLAEDMGALLDSTNDVAGPRNDSIPVNDRG